MTKFRFYLILLVLVLPVWPVSAQVLIQGDITVRPPPESAPAGEQLAYALRLYEADRLGEALSITRPLAEGHGPHAPEALFLLGRIQYSQGHYGAARASFENLLLRFPDSAPVRSGQLVDRIEQGTAWLLERHDWNNAKPWLALLEPLSPAAVGRLARWAEAWLDAELARFHERALAHRFDLQGALTKWLEPQLKESCDYIYHCPAERDWCLPRITREMQEAERSGPADHRAKWLAGYEKWFIEQRDGFAKTLLKEVQDLPMLRKLVSDQQVLDAVRPARRPEVEAPFSYRVIRRDFTKNDNAWRWSGTPYLGARLCREVDSWRADAVRSSVDVLTVEPLDRMRLLRQLGAHLRDPSQSESPARPRL